MLCRVVNNYKLYYVRKLGFNEISSFIVVTFRTALKFSTIINYLVMVGQVGIQKRLKELRNLLDETCKELGAKEFVKEALSDFLHITQTMNEIKVLKRKRTDLKIRIRNLERELNSGSPWSSGSANLSRASNTSFTKFLENGADDTSELTNGEQKCTDQDYEEIDFADEYFDPEEEKSPHFRPYPEYVPSNSLPHSQRRFRHEKRVGLLRDLNSEPRGLNTGLVGTAP